MRSFQPSWAPESSLPVAERGRVVARFCRGCANFYPLFARVHAGTPSLGRDHVSSPCANEGQLFAEGASWWEPGVEMVRAPEPATSSPAA